MGERHWRGGRSGASSHRDVKEFPVRLRRNQIKAVRTVEYSESVAIRSDARLLAVDGMSGLNQIHSYGLPIRVFDEGWFG